jgi:hypothetical protein
MIVANRRWTANISGVTALTGKLVRKQDMLLSSSLNQKSSACDPGHSFLAAHQYCRLQHFY